VHDPALLPLLAQRVMGLRQGRLAFDCAVSDLDEVSLKDLYASPDPATAPAAWVLSKSSAAVTSAGAQPIS
jgi:phosphonate transport system ATP-binding protein